MSLEDFVEPRREATPDVQKRAQQFLDALIADAAKDACRAREAGAVAGGDSNMDGGGSASEDGHERIALVVSHGGLLHVMMSLVMGFGRDIGFMGNCAVATVEVLEEEGGGVSFVPRDLNDDSHTDAAEGVGVDKHIENFSKILDDK